MVLTHGVGCYNYICLQGFSQDLHSKTWLTAGRASCFYGGTLDEIIARLITQGSPNEKL